MAVGGWWWLAVGGGWRLVVVGGWQLVAVGDWGAVGGPWGAVLNQKKIGGLQDRPGGASGGHDLELDGDGRQGRQRLVGAVEDDGLAADDVDGAEGLIQLLHGRGGARQQRCAGVGDARALGWRSGAVGDQGRLAVGGGWQLVVVGGWQLVAVGDWGAVGGWWIGGGWRLVTVGSWQRLAIRSGWRLVAVGSWWWLAVGS